MPPAPRLLQLLIGAAVFGGVSIYGALRLSVSEGRSAIGWGSFSAFCGVASVLCSLQAVTVMGEF